MKFSGLEIFEYRLPLKRSFSVLDCPMTLREGLIVRLVGQDGSSGLGEVAPLVGLSQETLKKAAFQLNALRAHVVGQDIPPDMAGLRMFVSQKGFDGLCPSVRFGLESAMVHWMSQKNKTLAAKMFGCRDVKSIRVAGLLQGTIEEIGVQARQLLHQDCEVFKLKVGNRNIPLDVRKVQMLRDVIGPQKKIRLDANRAWSLIEAVAFAQNAGKGNIEFIEEPLKDIADLPEFISETGFSVALDESIEHVGAEDFVFPHGVTCVVIKPTMVGGILRTLEWISKADKEGKGVVISSCFESGIGLRMLANLAACSSLAAGLGTDGWFAEDLLPSLRPQSRFTIAASELAWDWNDVRRESLKLIS